MKKWVLMAVTAAALNAADAHGPVLSYAPGRTGHPLEFDSRTRSVELPVDAIGRLHDFSIATWVKMRSQAKWQRVFEAAAGPDTYAYLTNGTDRDRGDKDYMIGLRFAISQRGVRGEQAVFLDRPLPTGIWTHVAVTLHNHLATLYVNGLEQIQNRTFILTPASLGPLKGAYIGRPLGDGPYLDGQVEDFRIYDRALTSEEVHLLAGIGGANPVLTVHGSAKDVEISPLLYGAFYEDINHAGDGGLYAELVRNRSFEDDETQPVSWSAVQQGGALAKLALEQKDLLNLNQGRCLRLDISGAAPGSRAGVANEGFWGIPVKSGTSYKFSLYAKAAGNPGTVTVSVEDSHFSRTYAAAKIENIGHEWAKYTATLTAEATDPRAVLVLSSTRSETLWLDMVSLFPPTYRDRSNGMRTDLAEMIAPLRPKVMRFPGGTFVHGMYLRDAFHWKLTIGDLAQRPGHNNFWKYRTSDGFGFHEFLQMAEDLGATPLYVANCGIAEKEIEGMDHLNAWVQDALDAIEYANGPVTSTWGAQRAANGHAEPFHLQFVSIGNESRGPVFEERYKLFYRAIRARYPDIKIVSYDHMIIRAVVPRSSEYAADYLDEHFYGTTDDMILISRKFDVYPRTGPKLYIGEYSATVGRKNTLGQAIAEAAFMTGLERNSDLVKMSAFAPLLANVNSLNWGHNLIYFDASRAFGTPSYYVQKMFAENTGDRYVPAELSNASTLALPFSVNRRSGTSELIIKMANETEQDRNISVVLEGVRQARFAATATLLTGDWEAENDLDHPDRIAPVRKELGSVDTRFRLTAPGNSVMIVTLKPMGTSR